MLQGAMKTYGPLFTAVAFTCVLSIIPEARAIENGVARLPVLGYNTWNAYACNIDESLIIETATLMKTLGLQVLACSCTWRARTG